MKKKNYCLIIDSGLGGLHILAKAILQNPTANFLYVADNKNLPYGNKSQKELQSIIFEIINRFSTCYNIKTVVLACNTATAATIDYLRQKLSIPIIGTEPNTTITTKLGFKNVAVLVTPLSASMPRIKSLIHANNKLVACPTLCGKIEDALKTKSAPDISNLIKYIKQNHFDAIVLGCTHYSFIASALSELNLPIFDSIDGTAKQISNYSHLFAERGDFRIILTSHNQTLRASYQEYLNQLLKV